MENNLKYIITNNDDKTSIVLENIQFDENNRIIGNDKSIIKNCLFLFDNN
ncbi:hypothetical protein [Clostridium pasteurianum]|uniref:Uncharacterized protein n=1 Tax=Clostridium pasteurianum BC1 TaxID=86416 RepID=R4K548_CLOPA|nr:hypothetical protein [Clostridium pasteurianum]AGK97693.1 hypothetical protein Clopa_2855 [Clostridium pasteurianum BC1]